MQCLPYISLSEAKMRLLANKIIKETVKRNMMVAGQIIVFVLQLAHFILQTGMVANGDILMKGNTYPLHVLQIRFEARSKVAKMTVKYLEAPTG